MGIPRFYADWLSGRNFPEVLLHKPRGKISTISIDLNSLLHDVASEVFGYNPSSFVDEEHMKILQENLRKTDFASLEATYHHSLATEISDIICNKPIDLAILAVDGLPPWAKVQQQRTRRYTSAALRPEWQFFDNSAITTGTKFMEHIDVYIKRWILTNRSYFPPKLIYSPYTSYGEGEHKIMDFARQGLLSEDGVNLIHGLDADLILLSLISPANNIYLQRTETGYMVNIDALRRALRKEMGTKTAVQDFVLFMNLVGNDFLPHVPSLIALASSINTLISVYRKLSLPLSNEDGVIWENFAIFVRELSKLESNMLASRYAQEYVQTEGFPSLILKECVKQGDEGVLLLDFGKFRSLWYANAFRYHGREELIENSRISIPEVGVDEVEAMCLDFLSMINWSFNYYKKGTSKINMTKYYHYRHAPFLIDLANVLEKPELIPSDHLRPSSEIPYNILHQLVSVMPPSSLEHVPIELHSLYRSDSELISMFPLSFKLELEGVSMERLGTALIEFADIETISEAINSLRLSGVYLQKYSGQGKDFEHMIEQKVYADRRERDLSQRSRFPTKGYHGKPHFSGGGRRGKHGAFRSPSQSNVRSEGRDERRIERRPERIIAGVPQKQERRFLARASNAEKSLFQSTSRERYEEQEIKEKEEPKEEIREQRTEIRREQKRKPFEKRKLTWTPKK